MEDLWDTFREYLNHPESKFDGNTGILERKHVLVSKIVHIGKESNNLDESEFLGVDSDSYEIYEDLENVDSKFKKIASDVLKLYPKDVKQFGISKQTLWNVKKKIKSNDLGSISAKIKVKLLKMLVVS